MLLRSFAMLAALLTASVARADLVTTVHYSGPTFTEFRFSGSGTVTASGSLAAGGYYQWSIGDGALPSSVTPNYVHGTVTLKNETTSATTTFDQLQLIDTGSDSLFGFVTDGSIAFTAGDEVSWIGGVMLNNAFPLDPRPFSAPNSPFGATDSPTLRLPNLTLTSIPEASPLLAVPLAAVIAFAARRRR